VLGGPITEDITLVAIPGHPWLILEDSSVPPGVTVTIEPGAVLKFGKGGENRANATAHG